MIDTRYIVIGMLLVLSAGVTEAQKLYRWVDDKGEVHYSDTVPPEYTNQERTHLNKRGLTVGVTEAAKTQEEIAREERLTSLRAEQQRLVQEQVARDEVLLKTFSDEQEMERAQNSKIATIDIIIQVTHSNISRLKKRLQELQKLAAKQERSGRVVAKPLSNEIASTQRQIEEGLAHIEVKKIEKQQVYEQFARDLERFRALKKPRKVAPISTKKEDTADAVLSVVECQNPKTCEQVWTLSKMYIQANASTPIETATDSLIMTGPPVQDEDISMIVSRSVTANGSTEIFLDIRCKDTIKGREFCKNEGVRQTKLGFRPYIQNTLKLR